MSSKPAWQSDFGSAASTERSKLLSILVNQIITAPQPDDIHEATVKVAAAATEYHQFLDTDPKVVTDDMTVLKQRIDREAQFDKADVLGLLQARLLELPFQSTQRDFAHRILSLLACLAHRILDTEIDRESQTLAALLGDGFIQKFNGSKKFNAEQKALAAELADNGSEDSWHENDGAMSPGDDLSGIGVSLFNFGAIKALQNTKEEKRRCCSLKILTSHTCVFICASNINDKLQTNLHTQNGVMRTKLNTTKPRNNNNLAPP